MFGKCENVATSSVNLEELIVVLRREGVKKIDILEVVQEILENFILEPVIKEDFKFAKEILEKEKLQTLFFMDCLVLSICKRRNYALLTFDKKLKRPAERLGVKVI